MMIESNFYKLSAIEKKTIFQEISNQTGIPVFAVEKDWWVVLTLRINFQMDIAPHIIFKGGTSLSKAWNIIDRFSEDIDLALDMAYLGFANELSRTQVERLRKKSCQFISDEFYPTLKQLFIKNNFDDVIVKLRPPNSSDQDPLIIELYYPVVTQESNYIEPRILVELGSRSLKEPNTPRDITSLVSEYFSNKEFADDAIRVTTVNPERTLLEKVFLLHEEFQKPKDRIRIDRMSRHLYDLERLMRTDFYELALNDKELYQNIVNHRKSITTVRGIDYKLHQPKTINPIPPNEVIKEWETDYMDMCDTMIYGDKLSFFELMTRIEKLKNRINQLEWSVES